MCYMIADIDFNSKGNFPVYSYLYLSGYKVAYQNKNSGNIFSIATGVQYPKVGQTGSVKYIPKKIRSRFNFHLFAPEILDERSNLYNPKLKGRTTFFMKKNDWMLEKKMECQKLIIKRNIEYSHWYIVKRITDENWRVVIIKATLMKKDLAYGFYKNEPCFVAKKFRITEVEK